jgi:hypothetical protein
MKRILMVVTSELFRVLALCVLITGVVWHTFPDIRSVLGGGLVFALVFGFVNILILNVGREREIYHSLVFPRLLHFSFPLSLANLLLFGGAGIGLILTVPRKDILFGLFQIPFLLFAIVVIIVSSLWWIAASKLTPKQGTMVVDEDDLYYLPGDVLPRLSSWAQIITPETKITIPVLRSLNEVSVMASFFFAPWVFTQEARFKLPGSMNYSTLLKGAENEYLSLYPDIKVFQDIWKLFWFLAQKEHSPYIWNEHPVISPRSKS